MDGPEPFALPSARRLLQAAAAPVLLLIVATTVATACGSPATPEPTPPPASPTPTPLPTAAPTQAPTPTAPPTATPELAPAVVGVQPTVALPGSVLTVQLSSPLDQDGLAVRFSNASTGFSALMPALPSGAEGTLSVAVPFHTTAIEPQEGTVSLSIVRTLADGRTVEGAAYPEMRILGLPKLDSAPGGFTLRFLAAVQLWSADSLNRWQFVTLASQGAGLSAETAETVDTAGAREGLSRSLEMLALLEASVRAVAEGEVSELELGRLEDGTPVLLTRGSLALLDRLLANLVLNLPVAEEEAAYHGHPPGGLARPALEGDAERRLDRLSQQRSLQPVFGSGLLTGQGSGPAWQALQAVPDATASWFGAIDSAFTLGTLGQRDLDDVLGLKAGAGLSTVAAGLGITSYVSGFAAAWVTGDPERWRSVEAQHQAFAKKTDEFMLGVAKSALLQQLVLRGSAVVPQLRAGIALTELALFIGEQAVDYYVHTQEQALADATARLEREKRLRATQLLVNVTDPQGQPASQATAELRVPDGATDLTTRTDQSGLALIRVPQELIGTTVPSEATLVVNLGGGAPSQEQRVRLDPQSDQIEQQVAFSQAQEAVPAPASGQAGGQEPAAAEPAPAAPPPASAPAAAPAPAPAAPPPPAPAAQTSAWSGSWVATAPQDCAGFSGTWSATLTIQGSQLSGSYASSDGTSGSVSGTASGDQLSWSVGGGGSGVSFSGGISGNSMSGSWTDGECSGSFSGSR